MKSALKPRCIPALILCFGTLLGIPISPRLLASTIAWGGGGGDARWDNPDNWIGGQLPSSTDDAVFLAGVQTIYVFASAEVRGLSLPSSATLNVSGTNASFIAHGATSIDGANLYAGGGGTLALPGLAHYSAQIATNGYPFWQADGASSVLDLDGLVSYTGAAYPWNSRIDATGGGRVTLGGDFAIHGGFVYLRAFDTNSLLEAPGMHQLAPGFLSVEAHTGGRVSFPELQTFIADNPDPDYGFMNWTSTDAGSVIDVEGLTNLVGSPFPWATTIAATAGARLNLGGDFAITGGVFSFQVNGTNSALEATNLTAIEPEGFSFNVANGARASLPGLQRWSGRNLETGDAYWVCNGTNSTLSLPALTTFVGTPAPWMTRFLAQAGGLLTLGGGFDVSTGGVVLGAQDGGSVLEAPGLRRVAADTFAFYASADGGGRLSLSGLQDFAVANPYGNPTFQASGPGSVVEMTSLTNFAGSPRPATTYLTAQAGGSLNFGGDFGVLDGRVTLTANGTNSVFMAPGLRKLAGIDVELSVQNGGLMTLQDVTSYSGASSVFGWVYWEADGGGSRLQLPALSEFVGAPFPNATSIGTRAGGQIELNGEFNISGGGVSVSAQDSASAVSAPALRRLAPEALSIRAEQGGRVSLLGLREHIGSSMVNGELWESNGTNSVLEVDGVTNFLAAPIPTRTSVSALAGGRVSIGGAFEVKGGVLGLAAIGPSSLLEAPGLTRLAPSQLGLDAEGGGRISLPALNQFSAANARSGGISWTASGAGSRIDMPALVSFSGTYNPAYTYLTASAGGLINLSAVVALAGANLNLLADGAGSTLNLGSAANLNLQSLSVRATAGGLVDLRSAPGLVGGNYALLADGAGSIVNLSSASIFDTRNTGGNIQALNSGSVSLAPAFLLRGASITGVATWGPPPATNTANLDAVLLAQPYSSVLIEMRPANSPGAAWQHVGPIAVLTNQINLHAVLKPLPTDVELRVSQYAADPPELQLLPGQDGVPLLILFGVPSKSYELDSSAQIFPSPVWRPATTLTLTNSFAQIPASWATNQIGIVRAWKSGE